MKTLQREKRKKKDKITESSQFKQKKRKKIISKALMLLCKKFDDILGTRYIVTLRLYFDPKQKCK